MVEKELTPEQYSEYWSNRRKTRKLLNVPKGWHMHHKDPSLRHTDVQRYIEWRPEDIEILSSSEHATLHNTGKNRKGQGKGEAKYASATGRKWCNNGIANLYLKPDQELPDDYIYGRIPNQKSLQAMNDYWKTHDHLTGNRNPACREEVKAKNRAAHLGKHRVYREDGTYYMN